MNIDVNPNDHADENLQVSSTVKIQTQLETIHQRTKQFSSNFDTIICTAGGFDVGNIKDNDLFEKYEKLDRMNAQSALLTGHLASRYLAEQGFLCITGAAAVFEGPVNYAFSYGMTKQATHSLVLQLAERVDVPKTSDVICILPTMIDTKANRESMPDADKSTWLPPDKVADLLRAWANGENRPQNGSFAKLTFKNGSVIPEFL
ncbi:UNKNOWN [Stylonychia lemnae]|uniref:Dihydropteridine reductase n=1 Tax=Stylonychia lemnae TaxID=5949 RepID=A0A078A0L2_STYLE|nr:UNKNOWN [Stylonychia lemnae]|eukprot:CDW74303.1 UNKNOWN [Stylonychia lemnae]